MTSAFVVPGINNNVCDGDAVEECPTDTVPTCTTTCRTPKLEGESCNTFTCSVNSVCAEDVDGTGRFTTSCVYQDASSGWKCRPWDDATYPGRRLLGECDSSTSNRPCPADTWCRDTEGCVGETENSELCSLFQLHNRLCDANHTGVNLNGDELAVCARCAPDTTCVGYDGAPGSMYGRCRKDCVTADDCPCDDGGTQEHVCNGGHCFECVEEGDNCWDGAYACCDDNLELTCGPLGDCCRIEDETCSTHDDCCRPEAFCSASTSLCEPCKDVSVSCTEDEECCSGLICDHGNCREMCDPNQECVVPNTKGVCVAGHFNCDGLRPVCESDTAASTEVCDGVDNDCDGQTDESDPAEGDACGPAAPTDFVGASTLCPGFTAMGRKFCDESLSPPAMACAVEGGVDYCSFNDQTIDEGFCGGAAGHPCNLDSQCPPQIVCEDFNGKCAYDETSGGCLSDVPLCWMPSENADCD